MNGADIPRTVRYVHCTREDIKAYVQEYVRADLRKDLHRAGAQWHGLGLQVWSALNPDPSARPVRPVADVRRYVAALVIKIRAGQFVPPPRIAQVRRDKARAERRRLARARSAEKRAIAEVAAALARGEHPGFGPSAPRLRHG